jgi:serine phosphatase RsbU (regulator of sigma subunit)
MNGCGGYRCPQKGRRGYTDGVYDGSDRGVRQRLEEVMREHYQRPAKDICNALLEHALKQDDRRRQIGEQDRIDGKTVFIIKRNWAA